MRGKIRNLEREHRQEPEAPYNNESQISEA